MYKFLTKNGQAIAFGLGVLITILFLIGVVPNISTFSDQPKEVQYETGIFNLGLRGAIALAIIAAIAMVGFGLFHVATNFKGSLKGIIGFAVLIVIFFIAYSTASTELTPELETAVGKFRDAGNGDITDNNLKFIGGGISTAGILIGLAALAFVFSEVRNLFK